MIDTAIEPPEEAELAKIQMEDVESV